MIPKTTEEWRPVPGWESVYRISSLGRLKNCTRDVRAPWGVRQVKGRIMSTLQNGNGYLFIYLKRGNTRTKAYLHRLVALAFLPNPDQKPYVNHRNRDRADNRLENLEWATESENTQHWMAHDRAKVESSAPVADEPIRDEDLPFGLSTSDSKGLVA